MKQLKGVGNRTINKKYVSLLEKVNNIEECVALVEENEKMLSSLDIEMALKTAKEKYNKIINEIDIKIITIFDEEYPEHFNDLKEKRPVILYAKGNVRILKDKSIAVVGTRKPSKWSEKVEHKLVQKIIKLSNRVIISGLALGCDSIAHVATIALNARTVAVLPSGVNVITPAAHKKLATAILENGGCLISEYEPDSKVSKSTYIERDGLIAALADAVLVIECGVKSGTMHTVDAAFIMKRELACYYIEDASKGEYEGNLYMMQAKKAIKISDAEDLGAFLEMIDNQQYDEKQHEQLSVFDMQEKS